MRNIYSDFVPSSGQEDLIQEFMQKYSQKDNITNPYLLCLKLIFATLGSRNLSSYQIFNMCFMILREYMHFDYIYIHNSSELVSGDTTINDFYFLEEMEKFIDSHKNVHEHIKGKIGRTKEEEMEFDFYPVQTLKDWYYITIINSRSLKDEEKEELNELLRYTFYIIISYLEKENYIKELLERDDLTKVKNRREFEDAFKMLKFSKGSVTFILFDLFRLKTINDNYGHSMGDKYIIKAAELIEENFPDETYRIGGDEFAVISPYNSIRNIDEIMEKINARLQEIMNLKSEVCYINYGYATEDSSVFQPQFLNATADKRLSDNKKAFYETMNIDRRK